MLSTPSKHRMQTDYCITTSLAADLSDCETFRIPPSMSKRTIRIPDEGEWRRIGGATMSADYNCVEVGQKFKSMQYTRTDPGLAEIMP